MLGNYDENNILFCSDLYNYRGLDIVEYLSLQKQTIDKAERSTEYSAIKKFIARVFIQQKTFADNYEENINKMLDAKESEIMSVINKNAKLKSLLEVQELYRRLFKSAAKKQVNVDEIVNEAKNQKVVLDMIRHILDQDDFKRAYPDDAKETKVRLTEIGYKRDENKIDICEEILSEYILDAKSEYKILAKLTIAHNQSVKDKKAGADK
jgi:hypothetical protein